MKKAQWGEDPEFSGPRDWFRNSLIIKEVLKRKKTGRVLDFGCGSGNLLVRLIKYKFNGIGLDASEMAIQYLKKRIKINKWKNILSVKLAKENELFWIKERVDIVVSGETLEHIRDDEKVIRGFYNVLQSQGICVISVPAHISQWDINDTFSSHFRRYESSQLRKLFQRAGFTVLSCYYWGFPLSLLWHRLIYNTMIKRKMKKDINYSKMSVFSYITRNERLVSFFSLFFTFDQLFNWTTLGGGLILVAQKP